MIKRIVQFKLNVVLDLVSRPTNKTIIGTKWLFKNKMDENSVISKNKVRIVEKCHSQVKWIDYEKKGYLLSKIFSCKKFLVAR